MTKAQTRAWLRRAGLATGFAVAVIGLLTWRMPHNNGTLGLDLRLSASQSGEVQAAPLGPFLSATAMRQGDRQTGSFTIRNETGGALPVRLRASAATRDADSSLRLRLSSGARVLYDGPLGGLRRPATAALVLPRAAARRVDVAAYIPASAAPTGYEGRILDVQLAPVAEAAR